MKYVNKSFKKFKDDLLANGIYDLGKWIFGILMCLILTRWIPIVSEIFLRKLNISVYWLLLISIALIGITIIVANFFFIKRIQLVEKDNETDELTGLRNHKALSNYLNQRIEDARGKDEPLSIILFDIDDFKKFNTDHGYDVADETLKLLGELLGNDKRATDETFRYYHRGDEFLVVAGNTSLSQAVQAADRKRNLIGENLFSVGEKMCKITVCCGVTELKKDDDLAQLTKRAADALKVAKAVTGKNTTKSLS